MNESPSSEGPADQLPGLLSADLMPLFSDRFIQSCACFEEYVRLLALQVVRETGIATAAREPGTPAEIAARAGLDPVRAPVPVGWLLTTLAMGGHARRDGVGRFTIAGELPASDPNEAIVKQEQLDPTVLASYRMAALAASLYPAVLRGTVSGEESLFSPDRVGAWFDYFSNDNALYAISNWIGAIAAERALGGTGGAVLEIGGGLGSGMAALLERFAHVDRLSVVRAYRFTEVAPSFLRRGQRRMAGKYPGIQLNFVRLDMDRPFAEAGVEAGAFALVYGVNTLHVARDLEFTLGEIRNALSPGSAVVISECVRPIPGRPIYIEFIFNLLEAFRSPRLVKPWRPNGGFLTPEQWTAAFQACGFTDIAIYPDISIIREVYPSFVVGAITAVRA